MIELGSGFAHHRKRFYGEGATGVRRAECSKSVELEDKYF